LARTIQNERQAVPQHVAIIMDGNGRWAQNKKKTRVFGHKEGAKRVDEIVTEFCELGIKYLTLYTFSTENWNRPEDEVKFLWQLLIQYLRSMTKKLIRNQVALGAIGAMEKLPSHVRKELDKAIKLTSLENPQLKLNLALSYGGRQEIVSAARAMAKKVLAGECSIDEINESTFQQQLYRPDFPDPDLLIRTGGNWRVSNFLLWEIAYSEIYVTDMLWPDFKKEALYQALDEFAGRERRFGLTGSQIKHHEEEAPCQP